MLNPDAQAEDMEEADQIRLFSPSFQLAVEISALHSFSHFCTASSPLNPPRSPFITPCIFGLHQFLFRTMGLFCCRSGGKYSYSPPPSPPPESTSDPAPVAQLKLARRKSARKEPKHKHSKQNIEAFYNEGKELLRAEREEKERQHLRTALQQTYARGSIDSSATQRPDVYQYDTGSQATQWPEKPGSRRGGNSMDMSAPSR